MTSLLILTHASWAPASRLLHCVSSVLGALPQMSTWLTLLCPSNFCLICCLFYETYHDHLVKIGTPSCHEYIPKHLPQLGFFFLLQCSCHLMSYATNAYSSFLLFIVFPYTKVGTPCQHGALPLVYWWIPRTQNSMYLVDSDTPISAIAMYLPKHIESSFGEVSLTTKVGLELLTFTLWLHADHHLVVM